MALDHAVCPICEALVSIADGTVESEIITCEDCGNRVVVESIRGVEVVLAEAPEIEEDWGE